MEHEFRLVTDLAYSTLSGHHQYHYHQLLQSLGQMRLSKHGIINYAFGNFYIIVVPNIRNIYLCIIKNYICRFRETGDIPRLVTHLNDCVMQGNIGILLRYLFVQNNVSNWIVLSYQTDALPFQKQN